MVRPDALADCDGDPFLGRTIAGRYVVLGKLGAGAMGTVYRARHEAMGRDVAVKILREGRVSLENARERFEREARALSRLASPHTVTVYDFGEIPLDPEGDELAAGLSLYLAMELLEGESLGDRLERTPRLSIDEAARVARHALLSLAEAHEKGVIHRDLKPDNLFLTRSPSGELHCKLLDFSIAKVMNDPAPRVAVLETQEGTVFGTPRYMSPEQAQGKALDSRSDLYSIGVLLYQMLTGRPPFTDEDAIVVMAHHIRSQPPPPIDVAPDAGLPKGLSDLVLRALAKDPARRPATARAFIEELDRALETREIGGAASVDRASVPASVDRASVPASVDRASVPASANRASGAPSGGRPKPASVPPPSGGRPKLASVPPPSGGRPKLASVPPPSGGRPKPASVPPPSEGAREGPNSLSSPPPRSLPLSPPRAAGLIPALVGVGAIAAGVLGGVLAFSLAHNPRPQPVAADDAALRAVAARVSTAVDQSREAEEAARELPASPGDDLGEEPAEGAVLGSDVANPAAEPAQGAASAAPTRAFEVPPPPPLLPRRRFNK
jgi:serine/threonine-protein kinase